jgi:hypothetical protein
MSSYPAIIERLVIAKRQEWVAMLLAQQPGLQQPLAKALQLVEQGRVAKGSNRDTFRVRGNPHDYWVNVAQRSCSCGRASCEHFLAAWFAFSEEEIVRERTALPQAAADRRLEASSHHHGRWQGPNVHICDDGYRETIVYGIGEGTECARCRTPYCSECDDTR